MLLMCLYNYLECLFGLNTILQYMTFGCHEKQFRHQSWALFCQYNCYMSPKDCRGNSQVAKQTLSMSYSFWIEVFITCCQWNLAGVALKNQTIVMIIMFKCHGVEIPCCMFDASFKSQVAVKFKDSQVHYQDGTYVDLKHISKVTNFHLTFPGTKAEGSWPNKVLMRQ